MKSCPSNYISTIFFVKIARKVNYIVVSRDV